MLWFVLACATKVVPVPQLLMGSPAPKTQAPAGEDAPSTFGNLGCGLTVGFQKVDERYVDALRTPEGDVLVVTEAVKGSYEATLVFSLQEKGLGWYSILGAGSDEDTPASLSPVADGYIIGGTTWSHGAGMSDGWITKLDTSGKVKWQRTYGLYDRDVGLGFAPIGSGGLFVTNVPDYGLVVQQLDELGGQTAQGGLVGAYKSMAMAPLSDGALIFGGVEKDEGISGRVLRLDASGNRLWSLDMGEDSPVTYAMSNGSMGFVAAVAGATPRLSLIDASGALTDTALLPPELEGLSIVGGVRSALGPLWIGQAEDGTRVVQMNDEGDVVWSQTLAQIAIQDALPSGDKMLFLGNGQGASSQDFFGIYLDAATGASVCVPEPVIEEPAVEDPALEGVEGESGEAAESGEEMPVKDAPVDAVEPTPSE
ncbi:MAG: hypothetical protein ACI9VR_004394 [Cognaticolwellia sp.]|jgi:hypothetical protein